MFFQRKDKIFYGWIIILLTMLITLILMGARFSFGVFFKPLASEFDMTRAATSSLFSVYMILCAAFTIAGGWAMDRYGPRLVYLLMGLFTGLSLLLTSQTNSSWQLYLSYSLLFSLGTAPFFPAISATVARWFERKRGLAMGFASSGSRIGQIVFAPFCAILISHFGWRVAFIVMGLMTWLIVIPASRLMRYDPSEIGAFPDGTNSKITLTEGQVEEDRARLTGLSLSQAVKHNNYWFFIPAFLLLGFSNFLVFTHVVPYATDKNITAIEASTILSVIGIFSIISGIFIGRISDTMGRKTPLVLVSLLRAAALVGLIWASELWMFNIFALFFGLSIGGTGVVLSSFIADIFGRRSIGIIFATLDVAFSIGAATGPFIAGLIYDINNSYFLSFLIGAAASVLFALLMILVRVEAKPEQNRK